MPPKTAPSTSQASKPGDKKSDQSKLTPAEKVVDESKQANEKDAQATFSVYVWNKFSKTSKMEKFVTLGSKTNVDGLKMNKIRDMLISEKAMTFEQRVLPHKFAVAPEPCSSLIFESFDRRACSFCNSEGATVDDDLRFDLYTQFLGQSKGDSEENDQNDKNGHASYKVYLKSRQRPTKPDADVKEAIKSFMDKDLNVTLSKAELPTTTVERIKSAYEARSFAASVANDATAVHPADMAPKHWHVVFETNALLRGLYVNHHEEIDHSMYPAFRLKARSVSDDLDDLAERGIKIAAGASALLKIPRFTVHDTSYVTVTEDATKKITAMAKSSLTEKAAEIAVGGGSGSIGGAAKASYKSMDEQKEGSQKETSARQMMITYNFPRVIVDLGNDSLELTNECQADLATVKDADSLEAFKEKYGRFIATRLELGGKLVSCQDSYETDAAKISQKANSMKAAAAISFSSPAVQASASASYGEAAAKSKETKDSELHTNLNWTATGGDTLLCNNPPAWCETVMNYHNWRVIRREHLYSIVDMILRIPGKHQLEAAKLRNLESPKKDAKYPEAVVEEGSVEVWLQNTDSSRWATLTENAKFEDPTTEKDYWALVNEGMPQKDTIIGIGSTRIPLSPNEVESAKAYIDFWKTATHTITMESSPQLDNRTRFVLKGKMHRVDGKLRLVHGVSYEVRTRNKDLALTAFVFPNGVGSILAVRPATQAVAMKFIKVSTKENAHISDQDFVKISLHSNQPQQSTTALEKDYGMIGEIPYSIGEDTHLLASGGWNGSRLQLTYPTLDTINT